MQGQAEVFKSQDSKGTIRADTWYRPVSTDVRQHRLISGDYIKALRCHRRGRGFESRSVSGSGSALARLRRYVLYVGEFLSTDYGVIMARLFTGVHEDSKLREMFLERYVMPRGRLQRRFIGAAIASGHLKRGTDPELLIDALNGPLFFRWLMGHPPIEESFAESLFDKVIPAFQPQ